MMKWLPFKKPSKKEKLKQEIYDELREIVDLGAKTLREDMEELRSISRLHPYKKLYDYTDENAMAKIVDEGYELVYVHPRCKYRVYIKRDR